VRAARTLAEERLANHDLSGAVEMAESLVTRRPFDARAIRLLMFCLAGSGQYALAVARYQTYVRLLGAEMGEKPPEDLERYARELRGCAASASLRPSRDTKFVGRTDEWLVLEETWSRAPEWDGALVLLQGGSGAGKTRLLEEFSDRARAGGAVVLDATRPEPVSRFPSTPAVAGLRSVARLPGLARLERNLLLELIRLLPRSPEALTDLSELDPGGEPSDSGALRHRALADCLKELAARDGLLITIDHLHWADPPSLRMLHFLARQLKDARALTIAAFRPEELPPEGRRFVDVSVSEGLGRLVRIGEVGRPVGQGHPTRREESEVEADDEAIAAYLEHFTGGNPARLFELLQDLRGSPVDGETGMEQALGSDVEALRDVIAAIISARDSESG